MVGEVLSIKVNDYLARYRLFVEQENKANRYNINLRAESFFIPILSLLYECDDLVNLNLTENNYPGLDLADENKRISFQVTSETEGRKIIKTLEKFNSDEYRLYEKYDKLIILMLQNRQDRYTSERISVLVAETKEKNPQFQFLIEADIIDLTTISKRINDFEKDDKEKLLYYLMSEIDGDFVSPLSKIPLSSREIVDIPLIGRDEEYNILLNSENDILIVGQPGIGKTFLLYKLLEKRNGYFVNDEAKYNLSAALDIIKPDILFVDDAHRNPELLANLRNIRKIRKLEFKIYATCWPNSSVDTIKYYGNYENDNIIKLHEFSRDLLAELLLALLKQFDLSPNDPLTQNIIDQSNGLPGLAVGLFFRCLHKHGLDVINGNAILSHIAMVALETRNQLDWYKTKKILACFSIGGKNGMELSRVADLLNMNAIDIEMYLHSMKFGGIIFHQNGKLVIRPSILRSILVNEIFFQNQELDLFNKLNEGGIPEIKYSLLLDIKEFDGDVPYSYFEGIHDNCFNDRIIGRYYRIFPERIMIEIFEYPSSFRASLIPALINFPQHILPLMLEQVNLDQRSPTGYPDHVFRVIPDWLNWDIQNNETINKRKLLLDIVQEYSKYNGNPEIVSKVLAFILSPSFDQLKPSVGSGKTISIVRGYFSEEILEAIFGFWPRILEILKSIEKKQYINVLDEIGNWVNTQVIQENVEDKKVNQLHSFAKKMILDIASFSDNQNSILRICNQFLFYMGEEKKYFTVDSFFETIYPMRYEFDVEKFEEIMEAESQDVTELAILFSKKDPKENYLKMREILKESRLSTNIYPDHFFLFITTLARNVDCPKEYIKFLINDKENPEYLKPFLDKIFEDNKEEFIIELTKMIDYPKYYQLVLNGLLSLQEPPRDLLDNCLEKYISQYGLLLQGKAKHGEISLKVLEILLNHPNNDISFHVAIGEWYANPYGRFREELEDSCKKAISDSKKSDSLLSDIFKKDSNLGYEWLGNYLRCKSSSSSEDEIVIGNTTKLLNSKQREGILKELSEIQKLNYEKKRLIKNIVENDIDIFRYLLELDSEYINEYKLAPLGIFPDNESWLHMALIAFENGFSESDIVYSCFSIFEWIFVTQLEKIQYYEKFITDFNNIYEKASIENSKIRKIALQGMYIFKVKLKEQTSLEEMKSIFGFDEMY